MEAKSQKVIVWTKMSLVRYPTLKMGYATKLTDFTSLGISGGLILSSESSSHQLEGILTLECVLKVVKVLLKLKKSSWLRL